MARFDTLPIYAVCYELLLRMFHNIQSFPKEYRYTLGERIQNVMLDMTIDIYRANMLKYKSSALKSLNNRIQLLYIYLRISHDMKILSMQKYASMIEQVDDISRQATGWLKSVEKSPESAQVKA